MEMLCSVELGKRRRKGSRYICLKLGKRLISQEPPSDWLQRRKHTSAVYKARIPNSLHADKPPSCTNRKTRHLWRHAGSSSLIPFLAQPAPGPHYHKEGELNSILSSLCLSFLLIGTCPIKGPTGGYRESTDATTSPPCPTSTAYTCRD